jgi:FKBP12-rapamycin complex-associated protein
MFFFYKAWDAQCRATQDDWVVWIRGFSVEMLKQSPIHALRSCSGLAQKYFPLAKELFNAVTKKIERKCSQLSAN